MGRLLKLGLLGAAFVVCSAAADVAADRQAMPEDARVRIIWPSDGTVVNGKFWLRMGLSSAGIAPAGVQKANTGHHHLLVDTDLPTDLNEPIPNDKNHLHFGAGQTEVQLDLPPGRHTLQLLFADERHIPHNPPLYSNKITIIVK
jgi:hypothetical protein